MTIFSLPRPFIDTDKGKFKIIQENAMISWKLTHPDTEVLIFGNESGVHQICDKLKFKHVPEVEVNNFGTPYLNDLFERAQQIATSNILCYLHSDIILVENLDSMIKEINKQFSKFLLVARRWDLFLKWNGTVENSIEYSLKQIDFNNSHWKQFLKEEMHIHGRLRQPGSCDCYIFTRDLYSKGHIPPFLLGRKGWDGWIIYDALQRTIATVDISSFKILHQTHMTKNQNLLPSLQWKIEGEGNIRLLAGRKKRVDQVPYFWKNNKLYKR